MIIALMRNEAKTKARTENKRELLGFFGGGNSVTRGKEKRREQTKRWLRGAETTRAFPFV